MDQVTAALPVEPMSRRTACVILGRSLLALVGIGAVSALGGQPSEALARSLSNTKKKPKRKGKSTNNRKGGGSNKKKSQNQ